MKNYFFAGVQADNLQNALQGLDELLKRDHADTDFSILQLIVCHEMIPGKIATAQPKVVCNVIAVLISTEEIPKETIFKLPGGEA